MGVIRIRELPGSSSGSNDSDGSNSPNAQVSFEYGEEFPATIRNPFSEAEEEQLAWYFEEYLRFPFTRNVLAEEAARSIITYGHTLFEQIFADRQAYTIYDGYVQSGLNTVQVEIVGSPQFHALHWEALKDPRLPQPLVLSATMVRKNVKSSPIRTTMHPSPTINLLVVTARPRGKRDVGYRTISRPLVDALRQARVPVNIEILRPGTYRAFENHLRRVSAQHGVGYYHVIHFDMHGAVLPYEQLEKLPETNRYQYNDRYGRPDLQPYEGVKAFLAFEGEQDDESDLVEASELADLLTNHQIPIAILNACQSGMQIGASETSLGSRLMQAGVQLVLAMGYSVTVSAAELLMQTLYKQLLASDDLSIAIRHARTELYNHRDRRAYFDQKIDLQDWLLPVVYQNQPVHLSVGEFKTRQEREAFFARQAALKPDAAREPRYGFVGRDLDILQIEKRLLTKRNILLVRGMGGAGKTTLLQHLDTWWRTTGFIEQTFYFGYDDRAWTRQQILVEIAQKLFGLGKYYNDFQPLSLDAQQAMLTQRLRSERHLLILDNLESITGAHLAIQHTLPKEEQDALQRFLADLSGGQTLVLLGSRGGEGWLAQGTFEDNVYELPGLDPEAASTLADRILEKYQVTKYRKDSNLQKLLELLDGFPLALEVVLANQAHQEPGEILKALQAGDIKIDPKSDSQKRTESILLCIDYSHSNLSPDAQQLLLCLAPFTSVFDLDLIEAYTDQLRQQPALAALPFERWPEVLQEAANWGLLSPDAHIPSFLHLQPILPYFLRNRLGKPEQAEIKQAVDTAFRQHYDQVGRAFYQLLVSKDPRERQIGQVLVSLEYENLMTALNLALVAQVSIINYYSALSAYLDLTYNQRRGLELGQTVLSLLENYPAEKLFGQLGVEFAGVIDNLAKRQLLLKDFAAAEASYQKTLTILLSNKSLDSDIIKKLSASIYHQLGRVAEEQRQWTRAEQYYQRSLQIYAEYNDRYEQARAYHQLGIVAQGQRQWVQAEQYYQQALQIYVEYNDRYSQASAYFQMGKASYEQRQWDKAIQFYEQALQIYSEFNDHHSQGKTYHLLGSIALEQRQWIQSEEYYQQALQIYVEYNDRYEQAKTYHQLGRVAQEQRQWVQAEQYYQQALQIDVEYNDRYAQASTYHGLGIIAQEQRQWAQARDYFLRALEIYVSYDEKYYRYGVLTDLAYLWQDSDDKGLPAAIAAILKAKVDEVEELLRRLSGDGDDKQGK